MYDHSCSSAKATTVMSNVWPCPYFGIIQFSLNMEIYGKAEDMWQSSVLVVVSSSLQGAVTIFLCILGSKLEY